MPDLAAAAAGPAAGEPPDDLFVLHDELQDQIESGAEVGEELVEGVGLRDGAGEAVEEEAVGGVPSASRSDTMLMVTSSGTSWPASM
ncbi:hypothetical protein GCM10027610_111880 [Dactylosporangium cerinum]